MQLVCAFFFSLPARSFFLAHLVCISLLDFVLIFIVVFIVQISVQFSFICRVLLYNYRHCHRAVLWKSINSGYIKILTSCLFLMKKKKSLT